MYCPNCEYVRVPIDWTKWPATRAFLDGRTIDQWTWEYRAMMPGRHSHVLDYGKGGRWFYAQGGNPQWLMEHFDRKKC